MRTGVDLGVEAAELGDGDGVLGGNIITCIARGDLVPLFSARPGAGQGRRVTGRWRRGGGGGGRVSHGSRDTRAGVIISLKVGAGSVDLGVPGPQLRGGDAVLLGDDVAAVAGLDLVEAVAVGHDARHEGRVAGSRAGGGGGGGRWGGGTGDPDADIVVGPEVGAGGVYFGVPRPELGHRDTVLLGDRLALITRLDLVEAVTVVHDARHGGGVAGVRGSGGTGGGGGRSPDGGGRRGCRRGGRGCRRDRGISLAPAVIRVLANNAVRLSSLEVGAGHARVDVGELLDRDAPARGHALAGLAALCLDVKVALYTTPGDDEPPVGRDKAQAPAGEEAKQDKVETCRVHIVHREGLLRLVKGGKE